MLAYRLSVHDWVSLPWDVRAKMIEAFKIERSSGTVVEGNRVVSDGHTYEDLKVVSSEEMQKFLGSVEQDFIVLLNLTINKITEELNQSVKQSEEELKAQRLASIKARRDAIESSISQLMSQYETLGHELVGIEQPEAAEKRKPGRPKKTV